MTANASLATINTGDNNERRLTARVEKGWRACGRTPYPRRCDIDRASFGNDWDFCFIVDLSDSIMDSRFSYVGTALREYGSPIFERQRLGETQKGCLLELVAKEVGKVTELKKPVRKSG